MTGVINKRLTIFELQDDLTYSYSYVDVYEIKRIVKANRDIIFKLKGKPRSSQVFINKEINLDTSIFVNDWVMDIPNNVDIEFINNLEQINIKRYL